MNNKINKELGVFREASKQKRKNARIKLLNVTGSFLIHTQGNSQSHECVILDIGTGGIGISTKTFLYPGDKIQIQFWLENQFFDIPAIVSRVSGKNVGLVFDNPEIQYITKIQDYIHSKLFK